MEIGAASRTLRLNRSTRRVSSRSYRPYAWISVSIVCTIALVTQSCALDLDNNTFAGFNSIRQQIKGVDPENMEYLQDLTLIVSYYYATKHNLRPRRYAVAGPITPTLTSNCLSTLP